MRLHLVKQSPKNSIGVGFASNGTSMIVPTVEHTKEKKFRFESKELTQRIMEAVMRGEYCLRCKQHPKHCTKRMFKKWD